MVFSDPSPPFFHQLLRQQQHHVTMNSNHHEISAVTSSVIHPIMDAAALAASLDAKSGNLVNPGGLVNPTSVGLFLHKQHIASLAAAQAQAGIPTTHRGSSEEASSSHDDEDLSDTDDSECKSGGGKINGWSPVSGVTGNGMDPGSVVLAHGSSILNDPSSGMLQQPSPSALSNGSSSGGGGSKSNGGGVNGGDLSGDAEGVWSPDIETAFQEALAIYPPCGRRKIILSEEGKMYGRNELIARYIKIRTGKNRTRKQVSSHIQVLARKKSRELQSKLKDHTAKEKAMASLSNMSSAQIVSVSAMHSRMSAAGLGGLYGASALLQSGFSPPSLTAGNDIDMKPAFAHLAGAVAAANYNNNQRSSAAAVPLTPQPPPPSGPAWEGRTVCTPLIRMVDFSAYLEPSRQEAQGNDPSALRHELVRISSSVTHNDPLLETIDITQIYDKFPDKKGGLKDLFERGPQNAFFLVKFWADISFNVVDEQSAFYGVDSKYESPSDSNMTIMVSTKVCSFGKQVVEKVETEYSHFENGRFVFRISRSPMCEYMINFVHKLKKLPEKYMMNSVLENFTILQVVINRDTQETLLCIAFVFEVADANESPHNVCYRLIKEDK